MVPVTQAFDAGIGIALLGHQGFETDFLITDDRFALPHLLIQGLPAQSRQPGLELTLLGLVFLIFLGGLGLAVQTLQLTPQLIAQVSQTGKVFVGTADTVFSLAAALLVLGNARRLFDKVAQIFRLGLDQLGDHALLDDRVAARPQPRTEEDIGNVTTTALGAIEVIGGLAVAGDFAADRYLGIGRILAQQRAVGVVEDQFDTGLAHRFARGGAVEDNVGHRLAAQVLGRAFAHDPAHGIDDIGLATAVGAYHRRHIAWKGNGCRVNEGLEAGQLDTGQAHAQATVKADSTRAQLRWA